ncbi:hypothetical protein C8046_02670 [Serinibacter arcticus]|uniref:AbiEi antitoxin C-terminal domain-containing protein n=1 Tax=Serinibacter arcticus TaxID=1655435 RepID=A0A2U1ZS09_9MICO|nr:hypothetical protein [Serinibacter arcticus]PWD49767.1 hypothetical protein C8046_02670 [Serinibacter arcticus]
MATTATPSTRIPTAPAALWRPRTAAAARLPRDLRDVLGAPEGSVRGDHLWDGPVAVDVPLSPALRARSAVRATGTGPLTAARSVDGGPGEGVVCLLAAAWIHAGGPPPELLHVALRRPVRARFGPVRHRCVDLPERDVVDVGGVRVTNPLATACDLARAVGATRVAGPSDVAPSDATDALRRLVAVVERSAVRARLLTAPRARARLARAALDEL